MDTVDPSLPAPSASGPSAEQQAEIDRWRLAFSALGDLLKGNGGTVSSTALRRELEKRGVADARPLVVEIAYFDPETSRERGIPAPDFKFHHYGRSFYSEQKYRDAVKQTEAATQKEAEAASALAGSTEPEAPAPPTRTNRQEEARLVTYVKSVLEELYISEFLDEGRPHVFDVHNSRQGGSFENVDIIAIHWRSKSVVDLVTVEAKLEFNAEVVQQALNYTRFSHRAWIAVPVETDATAAAHELREKNPTLFEYVVEKGLGILACHRRQGRRYDVFPVHWPRRSPVDPLEQDEFVERYRQHFEEAGIVEPRSKKAFPRLR